MGSTDLSLRDGPSPQHSSKDCCSEIVKANCPHEQRSHLVLNSFLTPSSGKLFPCFHHTYTNHHSQNNCIIEQTNKCPSENGESESKNSHSNFLYIYFFFSYYLCLTPFRFKRVKSKPYRSEPMFEIHEYLPQKILCGIANILALLRYSVELRRCIEEVKKDNPISFFKLFETCSSLVFKTVIFKCFWVNKGKFLKIVKFLDNPLILPFNKFKMESIYTISFLCTFYVIIGFARMITGSGFVHSSELNPSWWARRLVAEGRYSIFLSNDSHFHSAPDHNEITSFDTIIAIITGVTLQCRFIAGYFVDLGILLCVLTLWAPVAGFSANIHKQLNHRRRGSYFEGESEALNPKQDGTECAQAEDVMREYKALKRLTELISEANGAAILPFISEAIFGYAIFFEDVIITQDFFHRIILICFYFCAVNILVFSADICRKMKCMKAWLWEEDRFSSFPSQKLMLILHDLSTNSIGITASGIFIIDFYLVGSMISVLITLFIIRLQYQTLDA